jgi:hypothetical protein
MSVNAAKFVTENGYQLFVRSMGKLHHVTHLAFNEEGHDKLFKTRDLICVAHLPNSASVQVLAAQYGGDRKIQLKNRSTQDKPFSDFYMRTYDGKYFQIAGVFNSVKATNEMLSVRDDTGPIDSTTIKGITEQYHFVASLVESKVTA